MTNFFYTGDFATLLFLNIYKKNPYLYPNLVRVCRLWYIALSKYDEWIEKLLCHNGSYLHNRVAHGKIYHYNFSDLIFYRGTFTTRPLIKGLTIPMEVKEAAVTCALKDEHILISEGKKKKEIYINVNMDRIMQSYTLVISIRAYDHYGGYDRKDIYSLLIHHGVSKEVYILVGNTTYVSINGKPFEVATVNTPNRKPIPQREVCSSRSIKLTDYSRIYPLFE